MKISGKPTEYERQRIQSAALSLSHIGQVLHGARNDDTKPRNEIADRQEGKTYSNYVRARRPHRVCARHLALRSWVVIVQPQCDL